MQLHYATGTISIAVAIALHEADISYDAIKVDFNSGEQAKPAYHAINPKGRVPALVLDDGTILTETGAILDYVAAIAPDAGLIPSDAVVAAQMRSVMYYLASTMHINHAHKMRGMRWADQQSSFDDMTAKVPQNMNESARFIEENALQGPFVTGDKFTVSDAYLFIAGTWLPGDGVDISVYPKLAAFMEEMENRNSVKAVRAAGML